MDRKYFEVGVPYCLSFYKPKLNHSQLVLLTQAVQFGNSLCSEFAFHSYVQTVYCIGLTALGRSLVRTFRRCTVFADLADLLLI